MDVWQLLYQHIFDKNKNANTDKQTVIDFLVAYKNYILPYVPQDKRVISKTSMVIVSRTIQCQLTTNITISIYKNHILDIENKNNIAIGRSPLLLSYISGSINPRKSKFKNSTANKLLRKKIDSTSKAAKAFFSLEAHIINEYRTICALIHLLERNKIKITFNEMDTDFCRLRIDGIYAENLTKPQKRHNMISSFVYNKGLNRDDCKKLYDYISDNMKTLGTFRIRQNEDCIMAPNDLNVVMIPSIIEAGYKTHEIHEAYFIVSKNQNNEVFFCKFISKEHTRLFIEDDKLILTPEITHDLEKFYQCQLDGKRNCNNDTFISEQNIHFSYIKNGDELRPVRKALGKNGQLLKTMFHQISSLKVSININKCKAEGLTFPSVILKHINRKFSGIIRLYDLNKKARSLFKPELLKETLYYIRSPHVCDYNWIAGNKSFYSQSKIPQDIRSRNRLQALKLYPAIYNELVNATCLIDNGSPINDYLNDMAYGKATRKIISMPFKKILGYKVRTNNKKKLNDKNISLDLESTMLDYYSSNYQKIDIFNILPFYQNKSACETIHNKQTNDFYNKMCQNMGEMQSLSFINSTYPILRILFQDNIQAIFDMKGKYSPRHSKNIESIMKLEITSLGRNKKEISASLLHIENAKDVIQPLKSTLGLMNSGELSPLMLLLYGTVSLNFKDLAKQSREYHKNLDFIQEAVSRIKSRFSLPVPPSEQVWRQLADNMEFPEGSLTFITSRQGLIDEAKIMSHCVWSYDDKCIYSTACHIASIKDKNDNRSTVQFHVSYEKGKPDNEALKISIVQNRSVSNSAPSPDCDTIAKKALYILKDNVKKEFILELEKEVKIKKEEFNKRKNTDLNDFYKSELDELGYITIKEYIENEIFNVLNPYLNKEFRNMDFHSAYKIVKEASEKKLNINESHDIHQFY